MKKITKYVALLIVCLCMTLQIKTFAQFGSRIPYYDYNADMAYHKECQRVQQHNDWVKAEEARLKEGENIAIGVIVAGIGLIAIGLCIRKVH